MMESFQEIRGTALATRKSMLARSHNPSQPILKLLKTHFSKTLDTNDSNDIGR